MEQENQEMKPRHHSIGSNLLFFFRYYRKEEPIVIWGAMGSILMGTLAPFLGIYLPKIALDLVIRRADLKEAIPVLGLSMIALVLAHGIWRLSQMGMYYYYNGQNTNLIALLVLKNLRIPYEYVESGAYRTLYAKAMEACMNGDWSAGSRMVDGTIHIAAGTLCFVLYSGVIGKLSCWMLVIILMLSLINYYLGIRKMRYEERMREEQARADRHYWSLRQSMGNVKGAKDIRIFGMSRWMHDLRERVLREQLTVKEKLYRNASFYEKLGFLLKAGKDLGAYGYLLCRACRGEIQAGEFVLYFGAITGFSGFLEEMISSFNTIRSAANSTDYLRAYLDLPEEKRQMGNRHVRELSTPIEISFRDVSFSYEKKQVFSHLNLTIHAGERIALVGVNGAGKSTFVKLLCGMYDPDEGQILLNGVDRNEFPRNELYQLFSAIFQEPMILPFTVGENLSLGRAEQVDAQRAWKAISDAGLLEIFREKKIDLQSYMTRMIMSDGIELSGGQMQRFLMARALYQNGPILVLDEPTAALDAIAESEVYESYLRHTEGKTAVFISHRLASTRFLDRIILIEDGRILEMGTHEELLAQNGAYAELFLLQSSYYKEGRDDGSDE